jgi:hypothetical protein
VERKIADVGDRGTPGYRREWQGILQAKKGGYLLDMGAFWISDKFRIRAVNKSPEIPKISYADPPAWLPSLSFFNCCASGTR